MYASGPQPHDEDDPLDIHAEGTRAISMAGVVALERLVLSSPPIAGVVLRYGHLYGPGTGAEVAGEGPWLHVDAAAAAALLAIEKGGRASSTSPSRAAN
jgi:nucleoside-diphosphate-sugar epimerase